MPGMCLSLDAILRRKVQMGIVDLIFPRASSWNIQQLQAGTFQGYFSTELGSDIDWPTLCVCVCVCVSVHLLYVCGDP